MRQKIINSTSLQKRKQSEKEMLAINTRKAELKLLKNEIVSAKKELSINKIEVVVSREEKRDNLNKALKVEDRLDKQSKKLILTSGLLEKIEQNIEEKSKMKVSLDKDLEEKRQSIIDLKDYFVKEKSEIEIELVDAQAILKNKIKKNKEKVKKEFDIIKEQGELDIEKYTKEFVERRKRIKEDNLALTVDISKQNSLVMNLKKEIISLEKRKRMAEILIKDCDTTYETARQKGADILEGIEIKEATLEEKDIKIKEKNNKINKLVQLEKNSVSHIRGAEDKLEKIKIEVNGWKQYKIDLIQRGDLYNRLLKQAKDVFTTANIDFPSSLIPISMPKQYE